MKIIYIGLQFFDLFSVVTTSALVLKSKIILFQSSLGLLKQ